MGELQSRLITMISPSAEIERVDADTIVIHAPSTDGRTIPLAVREADLAAFVAGAASDGLAALGTVGDDTTGRTAALGLLAVHIEAQLHADSARGAPIALEVRADGLHITRG